MSVITEREADKYERMWAVSDYGAYSPGEEWIDTFVGLVKAERHGREAGTLLDIGCGTGKAGDLLAAKGFDVTLTDLNRDVVTSPLPFVQGSVWSLPERAERFHYGYCCDVFEHLPPEYVMLCVDRVLRLCEKVFLTICTQPDGFGVRIGETLHLTVRSFVWWRDNLREVARVIEARDCGNTAVFYIEAHGD